MEKERNKTWERIKARLQHRYRLVAMNDDTFEEVGSYRLTLLNVYITFSVVFVVLVTLVIMLFVFTPIKEYLPGYSQATGGVDSDEIEERLEALELEVKARSIYIESVRNALTNNVEYAPEASTLPTEEMRDTTLNVDPSADEYQLRKAVERIENGSDEEPNFVTGADMRTIEQIFFVPPLKGSISAGFRYEKKHFGIDIVAPRNSPIMAVANGVVITSDWTYATGNVIAIQHENNIVSFYKHNSALLKKVGNFVRAGEAIAIIGNSGEQTDGPHLHFELWYNGNPVNPADYVSFD